MVHVNNTSLNSGRVLCTFSVCRLYNLIYLFLLYTSIPFISLYFIFSLHLFNHYSCPWSVIIKAVDPVRDPPPIQFVGCYVRTSEWLFINRMEEVLRQTVHSHF